MSSEVRFERVLSLPATDGRKKSTVYFVADSDPDFVEIHITGKNPANVRRLLTRADIMDQSFKGDTGDVGPQGPSGELLYSTAVGAISALRVVANNLDGVSLINPSDLSSVARMSGVATHAAADGDDLIVRRFGLMSDPSWSWVAAQPIFCGAGGVLTGLSPSTVAIRQVAVAIDATTIMIDPSDLIILE